MGNYHGVAAECLRWRRQWRFGYSGGSGISALSFAYTVTADDGAITLVRAGANNLSLNGGAIWDSNGIDAKLAHRVASQNTSAADDTPAPGRWG